LDLAERSCPQRFKRVVASLDGVLRGVSGFDCGRSWRLARGQSFEESSLQHRQWRILPQILLGLRMRFDPPHIRALVAFATARVKPGNHVRKFGLDSGEVDGMMGWLLARKE